MLDMDSADANASASPPGYKSEDRAHATPTSFMISDILHSPHRSPPRQRSSDGGSSEQEDDTASVADEERNHAAANGANGVSDAEDGERESGSDSKSREGETRGEDCCGASPKSTGVGSPGE